MRMLPAAAALGLVALALPVQGLGGVVLTGAGTGTYTSGDGAQVCADTPFTVQVVYAPDGRGSLATEFTGSCAPTGIMSFTGGVRVDTTQGPPVRLLFFCAGSEAAGMRCDAVHAGHPISADLGPSAGPGSTVTLGTRGTWSFDGAFTAA